MIILIALPLSFAIELVLKYSWIAGILFILHTQIAMKNALIPGQQQWNQVLCHPLNQPQKIHQQLEYQQQQLENLHRPPLQQLESLLQLPLKQLQVSQNPVQKQHLPAQQVPQLQLVHLSYKPHLQLYTQKIL